ncbi:thymidine kinase [Leptotrichia sp. OH3620_COT-345]|uniref:thymidine kinase n=1 Tax=Leptotrichia sp. OH3620_COT-345 TaxID=2491048 RepID=UPI000F653D9B|nr:thymidine kinase [Leptotrichia sp. OH3620_COT-345]RRD40986.1 thymidine kinase [Leptotrichia sp. OH3620_COT-345]
MEFHLKSNIGILEVITGSMFSGKSEELIRRLRRAKYAKQKVIVFKHSIDRRYGEGGIYSHANSSLEAYPVNSVKQMEEIMEKNNDTEVIGIDEIQFFGEKEDVVGFCKKYVEFGKRVIVAGLDMSFRAEPYHPMPELMGIADQVDKFRAICTVCGKPAYASQRLINGKPAYYDDPLVLVGASENYEARCRRHHIVRYRKNNKGKIYFIVGTDIGAGKKSVEKLYSESILKDKKIKTIILSSETEKSENRLSDLRKEIEKELIENDFIFIRIVKGILFPLEGNYTVLDFMCEYRKSSEIILVSRNKKGLLNQVLLTVDILRKSDLNFKEIVYTNRSDIDKEDSEIIEEVCKLTKLSYRVLE